MTSRISLASKALKDRDRKRIRKTALMLMQINRKNGFHYPRKTELALRGKR